MKTIAIVGAGGFAREVEWLIHDISATSAPWKVAGFLVSDLSRQGEHDSEVLGDFSWLRKNRVDALAMGIGNPQVRVRIADELKKEFPEIGWPALIHPTVRYDQSCEFGEGCMLCAGNIATVNVRIERLAMVNLSCTIGHETVIGEGTVINPLCAISGGVQIGKRVLIGTHSAILQYVRVGDDAVIGSAAMVNKDVPGGVTVMGVPAKPRA